MDAIDIILRGYAKELREIMECAKCGVDLQMKNPKNPEEVKKNWDLYCAKCFREWFADSKDSESHNGK